MSSPERQSFPSVGVISAQRSAILQAAIEILQHRGAAALTVRSVAAAAGCSTTGVYTWFGDKNGLVEAIYVDGFERFAAALLSTRDIDPVHRVRRQADAYRAWALANPTHYMVMFGGAVPDFVPSESARVSVFATFEILVDSTAAAIESNVVVGQPSELAYYLWAGIHGHVSLELVGMAGADTPAERELAFGRGADRLVRGCAGEAPARD